MKGGRGVRSKNDNKRIDWSIVPDPLSRDGKRVAEIILNERVEAKLECSRRFSFGSPLKDPEQRGFASPRGKERAFC